MTCKQQECLTPVVEEPPVKAKKPEPEVVRLMRTMWKSSRTLLEQLEPGFNPSYAYIMMIMGERMGEMLDMLDGEDIFAEPVPEEVWEVLHHWLLTHSATTEHWHKVADWVLANRPTELS